MEGGNKNLIQKFVCKKLSRKGFHPSCCTDIQSEIYANGSTPTDQVGTRLEESPPVPLTEELLQALMDASEEFELRYIRAFNDLACQLHITPDTAYQSFEQVVHELFRDGINWGRIVAFFCFGGALCFESADKEMEELLPRIIQWMATYLDSSLEPWIQQNGGWEAFVSLYGNDAAAESRKSQERFGMWLLTGVTLAGFALLASYLIRR
ncbi:PREDICTED: bcl-2-like protein 1 [Nanorana parkeri]|uniref:bcl-2-like protein 1 n=1 Tax=Nanorana parkeri TaxID=125878 RepID=UPI0008547388|nr:PREDICTED: bcl-2-like protein 1 [Nanorana parkeri]